MRVLVRSSTLTDSSFRILHFLVNQEELLVDFVAEHASLATERVEWLASFGSIWIDGKRCFENRRLSKGSYVRVHKDPRRFRTEGIDWHKRIIFENHDLVVIDKPFGLPLHSSVDNSVENVISQLKLHINLDLLVTHRLDVPTQGLVVLAKTKDFQKRFNELMRRHSEDSTQARIEKVYTAHVKKNRNADQAPLLEEKLYVHHMQASNIAPKIVQDFAEINKTQECRMQILKRDDFSPELLQLTIQLLTGRTHQIRAQLAHLGHPIIGDVAYGGESLSEKEKILLKCSKLTFEIENENFEFALTDRFD